jgi:uncharacterized protein YaiE (UPF0345 family)
MALTNNLGRLAAGLTADASLNIGVGVTPSGTYKFEVGTTSKFTGVATFGSTLSNGTYTYTLPSATGTLALTSAIPSVSGTTNYISKFTGSTTLGNSLIFDNGTNVGINTASPESIANNTTLQIDGTNHSFVRTGTSNYGGYFFTIPTADAMGLSSVRNPVTGTFSNTGKAGSAIVLFGTSGNGYMSFSTSNANNTAPTEAMRIFSDGNTLIQTGGTFANAGYKLDVNGTGRFTGDLRISGALIGGDAGFNIGIDYNTGGTPQFAFYGGTTAEKFKVTSTGAATFSSSVTAKSLAIIDNVNTDLYNYINNQSTGTSATARFDIGVNVGSYAITMIKYGLNYSGTLFGNSVTNSSAIFDNSASSNGFSIGTISSTPIIFGTANSERMRITSGGNVGIGTTSPVDYTGYRSLHIMGASSTSSAILYLTNSTSSIRGLFFAEGTANRVTIGSQSTHDFTFLTNDTERMRITSGGSVLLGTTTDASNVRLQVAASGGAGSWISGTFSGSGSTDKVVIGNLSPYGATIGGHNSSLTAWAPLNLNPGGGNVLVGVLAGTGSRAVLADASGNLSAPISDSSVKENIKPLDYGIADIMKLKPVAFEYIKSYKNYGEGKQIGNIAQDVAKVIPEAVFTTPSTGKMGINYDQLNGIYIKALQELQEQIKELQSQINK